MSPQVVTISEGGSSGGVGGREEGGERGPGGMREEKEEKVKRFNGTAQLTSAQLNWGGWWEWPGRQGGGRLSGKQTGTLGKAK